MIVGKFRITDSVLREHIRKRSARDDTIIQGLLYGNRPANAPDPDLRHPVNTRQIVFVTGSTMYDWDDDFDFVKEKLDRATRKMIDPIVVTTQRANRIDGVEKLARRWASWYFYLNREIHYSVKKRKSNEEDIFLRRVKRYIADEDPDLVVIFRDVSFWHWKEIRDLCHKKLVPLKIFKQE